MEFLSAVQLDQNQLLNVVIHKAATPPTTPAPISGQLYYDTVLGTIFYYNGSAWVDFSGDITAITAGNGLTGGGTSGVVNLDVNVDNATIEIVGDVVRIKAAGVTANELASDSVTSIKILDKAISFQKIQDIPTMTVIGRVAAGTGVSSAITILNEANLASNSATALATQQSIKAYVDASVSAIGTLIGGYVPSGTTFPGSAATKKGDYWYVTGAGTVQGVTMNIGDLIIANQANPTTTTANHYIFLESNRDQATTTILGMVYLATNAEALTGTDANKAVTPVALRYVLDNRPATSAGTGLIQLATSAEAQTGTDPNKAITPATLKATLDARVGGYAVNVGDNTANSFIITHNLNTLDVSITLIEIATGKVVYCDFAATAVNTVSLNFTRIPTLNKYRAIIKK